jgi:hypothetical protein
VAWGFTEQGERVLLSVMPEMRESHEDWLALGRDLIARGLGAPLLIVADGAPGLIKAVEQCWPASDRQRCCVHRARNPPARCRPPSADWHSANARSSLTRLQRVTIAASARPEGVASAVLAYACTVRGTDEPRRGDDPDNCAQEVELKDVASSKRARDEPSDERAGDAKQHGEPRAYPLASGQHKPRDEANDDPNDDETKDLHGTLITGASAPKQPRRRGSVITDLGSLFLRAKRSCLRGHTEAPAVDEWEKRDGRGRCTPAYLSGAVVGAGGGSALADRPFRSLGRPMLCRLAPARRASVRMSPGGFGAAQAVTMARSPETVRRRNGSTSRPTASGSSANGQ